MAKRHRPDVVLMDIRFPESSGLNAIDELRFEVPEAKIVVLSAYDNPTYIARAAAMGASDYLSKGCSRQQILATIHAAVEGTGPPSNSLLREIDDTMKSKETPDDTNSGLTKRETQVLRHVALGLNNKEIGLSLGISVETVKEHVQHVLKKISTTDRTRAAIWAIRSGFVD